MLGAWGWVVLMCGADVLGLSGGAGGAGLVKIIPPSFCLGGLDVLGVSGGLNSALAYSTHTISNTSGLG